MTAKQRSHCMSRIKNKDTDLEILVRSALHKQGLRFRKHLKELPGKPDVVFTRKKIAVFIDGDFWHGYGFHKWKNSVPPFWQEKIGKNRTRDCKNTIALRSMGWRVVRIWQHSVEKDLEGVVKRIQRLIAKSKF